jgi:hypothetical protein
MAGDITRSTFEAKKHYSGVRMQQGRVQMDADWNEQLDIRAHVERTTNLDVIGPCCAPEPSTANFAVEVQGGNLLIRQGRIYVDGILCENNQDVLLALPSPAGPTPVQPDLPGVDIDSGGALSFESLLTKLGVPASFAPLPLTPGTYSAYLDVWERDIVALDDSSIREVALGGPDATTRTKVVWQVKLMFMGEAGGVQECPTDWSALASTGLLAARAQPDPGNNDPCAVPAQAGYRRLENQLYRVEIHAGGDAQTATFKWSRDNASVTAGWTGQDAANPNNIFVTTLGKDRELGFSGGQWVELTDDTRELWSIPGTLVQLKTARVTGQGPTLAIDPATAAPPGPVSRSAFPINPKVRRWDQVVTPSIALVSGARAVQENTWLDLEDGVQVFFPTGGTYQTGDYWLIPARTATAISTPAVEWPVDASATPRNLPPAGIRHHYCALALLEFNAGNTWTFLQHCRPKFPPLTKLTQLHYVSGDGQEAPPGQLLPQPLQVGVANGSFPVQGARVSFKVVAGTGKLQGATGSPQTTITVQTGTDGVAECKWQLDPTTPSQRVEAVLISGEALPVRFNASFGNADLEPGVHIVNVVRIDSGGGEAPLRNDSDVLLTSLMGIQIVCDKAIEPHSISRATCFVTIELPSLIQYPSFTLIQVGFGFQTIILEASVNSTGSTISWSPSERTTRLLRVLNGHDPFDERGLLAHLTLKGNFVWSSEAPLLYVDGDVFGARTVGPGTTDLVLPSGEGRRGGTFEMWFWLIRSQP